MQQRSLISALLNGKCPQCRTGDMFAYPATSLTRFNKMNERCPCCSVRLEPEPGFYQGAMYVGYAFTVAIIVAVGVILYTFFDNPSEWIYVGVAIGIMVLLIPFNYRYSRILFLYMFGGLKYKPELSK